MLDDRKSGFIIFLPKIGQWQTLIMQQKTALIG